MVLSQRPGKLLQDMIGPLFISLKIRTKVIGEKEQFQDGKNDQEFNQDNLPQGPAYRHGLKSILVEGKYSCEWLWHIH